MSAKISHKNKVFLDTNIIIYQFDKSNPEKCLIAQKLIEETLLLQTSVISTQVVQEFLNVALKKFSTSINSKDVDMIINDLLEPLCMHKPNINFYLKAISLHSKYSLSFYDALIIQAAIDLGCDILYSEDLQDNQIFDGLRIVNPFS
jgi:predicted nucleic acid-binding protein